MAGDFIKLHRKMLKWGWYDDANTCRLFIHCLLRTNWKAGEWHGIHYEAGQFITSLETLAKETRLTVSQVRTSLKHLTLTGELTSKSQGKCRVITVNNWYSYQVCDKENDKEIATSSQDDSKEIATDKEVKNKRSKEVKNKKNIYGEYQNVKLTEAERDKLCNEYGNEKTREAIKFLDEYIEMKGYKARSHYLAIRKWVFDAVKREKAQKGGINEQSEKRTDGDISAERESEIREIIRRIESGEADHDDDGLWDGLP